jgi:hypothetical protein
MKKQNYYPKLIAFYLPQFHPIPENDAAWGKGFTDWTNVKKAKPLFSGHYQPRLPGELGFYDLRDPNVIEMQASLAMEYGIHGFCFYYYYFNGKRLLYKPIDNFLKIGNKYPFCFLWANENWTKRWDGGDDEIILNQYHSAENNLKFIRGLLPICENDSYMKINNKPILLIYKTWLIPELKSTVELWKYEAKKFGFDGIYLIYVDDWGGGGSNDLRGIGFNASYEIPSNNIPALAVINDTKLFEFYGEFKGQIVDYNLFSLFYMLRPLPDFKRYKTVMLPWDNSPRYGFNSAIYVNGLTEYYSNWLLHSYIDTFNRYEGDERLIFVHSWNEWCEGTYLEPDRKNGRKFLEVTRDTITIAKEIIGEITKGYTSEELNICWNSYSMILTRPMRNLARRLRGLPPELKPEVGSPAEARRAIETLQQSISWELTGPLRVLKRYIDRLVKGNQSER